MIVLDSHLWFWWINLEFDRFPAARRVQIEEATRAGISSEALNPAGIELFSITSLIPAHAVALPEVHRDPFDRLIIATALEYEARLASVFKLYPELSNHLLPS